MALCLAKGGSILRNRWLETPHKRLNSFAIFKMNDKFREMIDNIVQMIDNLRQLIDNSLEMTDIFFRR